MAQTISYNNVSFTFEAITNNDDNSFLECDNENSYQGKFPGTAGKEDKNAHQR